MAEPTAWEHARKPFRFLGDLCKRLYRRITIRLLAKISIGSGVLSAVLWTTLWVITSFFEITHYIMAMFVYWVAILAWYTFVAFLFIGWFGVVFPLLGRHFIWKYNPDLRRRAAKQAMAGAFIWWMVFDSDELAAEIRKIKDES